MLAETWWNWYQRRDKKKEKWALSPHYLKSYFFFPPANQNCYVYIVFNYYVLFLFGSAVTISSIYLTMNPQSEEEIVNQFRKLTNTYSKLFCAHNSTFHILQRGIRKTGMLTCFMFFKIWRPSLS